MTTELPFNADFEVVRATEFRGLKDISFSGGIGNLTMRVPDTAAQTAANYTAPYFIASRNYVLVEAFERHEALGTDGAAVTVDVFKVADGTAPASGVSMLSGAFSLKTTINTNQTTTPSTTYTLDTARNNVLNSVLKRGDSVSLITSGTLTAVKGVTVTIILKAL